MSAKLFGISINQLEPNNEAALERNAEGLWTCSQEFTCRHVDYGNVPVTNRLRKGTPITTLNPVIPILFEFITLRSIKIIHQKGGLTKIRCEFSGADATDGFGSDGNERSVSTSLRSVLSAASILEHPTYKKEVTLKSFRAAIAAVYNGTAGKVIRDPVTGADPTYTVYSKDQTTIIGGNPINDPDAVKWMDKVRDGVRTYDKAQLEYTITYSNKGGIEQEELDTMGRAIETPPNDPITPTWKDGDPGGWWQHTGVTEDKDENSSSYSLTYILRDDERDLDIYPLPSDPA